MKEHIMEVKEKMKTSIFEVFEKMFFIFLEPDGALDRTYDVESSISFSGSSNGKMRLFFSKKILEAIVENLLGMEEGKITETEIEDCAKEAVNMVCGNFLVNLDKAARFDLTIPQVNTSTIFDLPGEERTVRTDFISEEGVLSAIVKFT